MDETSANSAADAPAPSSNQATASIATASGSSAAPTPIEVDEIVFTDDAWGIDDHISSYPMYLRPVSSTMRKSTVVATMPFGRDRTNSQTTR